jgi:hypothetical protein
LERGLRKAGSVRGARLDQAEDYLNERLAASGEFWRLFGEVQTSFRSRKSLPSELPPHNQVSSNAHHSLATFSLTELGSISV